MRIMYTCLTLEPETMIEIESTSIIAELRQSDRSEMGLALRKLSWNIIFIIISGRVVEVKPKRILMLSQFKLIKLLRLVFRASCSVATPNTNWFKLARNWLYANKIDANWCEFFFCKWPEWTVDDIQCRIHLSHKQFSKLYWIDAQLCAFYWHRAPCSLSFEYWILKILQIRVAMWNIRIFFAWI